MFDPFLEELNRSLKDHGAVLRDLPDEFKEYFETKSKAKIRNWLWDVPGFRRWRVTRLDAGDKLQVLNSVAYPNYDKEQPIMGLDLLWFEKSKKLVAVLDFQPLIQDQSYFDKYFSELINLKDRFPKFNNQNHMFSYDPKKYFSPWLLFCKGGMYEASEMLPDIFTLFIDSYWKINSYEIGHFSQLSSKQIENLQINYDRYGEEKDPAHSLFEGFFGKEWSAKFIKEFLFPLSSQDK
tara:strand:- start:223 stop:933 length:711 start_codon:yes stop_codon:yes gene_type:complete